MLLDIPCGDCTGNVPKTICNCCDTGQEKGRKDRKTRTPPKSHIAKVLGGHKLDEQSGRHLKGLCRFETRMTPEEFKG